MAYIERACDRMTKEYNGLGDFLIPSLDDGYWLFIKYVKVLKYKYGVMVCHPIGKGFPKDRIYVEARNLERRR